MIIRKQETVQSRMSDQLADLDARGLMLHAQCIVDDMKYDVRDGDEQHLAIYANGYVAFGRVLEAKYAR